MSETVCTQRQLIWPWKPYFQTLCCSVLSLCIHSVILCLLADGELNSASWGDYLASMNWDDHIWNTPGWVMTVNQQHLCPCRYPRRTAVSVFSMVLQLFKHLLGNIWRTGPWVLRNVFTDNWYPGQDFPLCALLLINIQCATARLFHEIHFEEMWDGFRPICSISFALRAVHLRATDAC